MKNIANKFSNLTNDELLGKWRENLNENELIFQEIMDREDDGRLRRKYDEIDEYIFKKYSAKKLA